MWLSQLDPKIVYLGTKENRLCDALSRLSYDSNGKFIQSNELPRSDLFFGKLNENIAAIQVNESSDSTDDPENQQEFSDSIHRHNHWSLEKTLRTLKSHGITIPNCFGYF